MKRRSFLKTVACLSAAVAVPFKDILAAPPVRGPKVVLRLYWRAVGNGIPLSWQSQPLGPINVGKNKGMVITGVGMKAKDLRLPKTTDHVEFVLSRDTKLEEVMRDALVGDWSLYSIWAQDRLIGAEQIEYPAPGDPGPALAPCMMNSSRMTFRGFDDTDEEGVMFKMGVTEDIRLRLVSGARYDG